MEDKERKCPICLRPNHEPASEFFSCDVCGKYRIHPMAELMYKSDTSLDDEQRVILSSIIRNRHERGERLYILPDHKKDIFDSMSVPSDPSEVIDLLLEYIALKTDNIPGKAIKINSGTDYPIFFTKDAQAIKYYIESAAKKGFINSVPKHVQEGYTEYENVMLTLDGWNRISELKQTKAKTNKAFVAMWFTSDLKPAWEDGFKKALKDTGFDPIRIDNVEHNNKICDEIIANIRKSGLVIADFTGQRGGVYFEAGFALGLGIPVIWTCRDTDLKELHFDTRQYNHIEWSDTEDLRKKLINRIEATIPDRQKNKS